VGVVFYALLAERVPPLAAMASAIGHDEARHLEFQVDYFARGFRGSPVAGVAAAAFLAIVSCEVTAFTLDHAPLLAELGVSRGEIVRRCADVAWHALRACADARSVVVDSADRRVTAASLVDALGVAR
jgi:hypothetical protein